MSGLVHRLATRLPRERTPVPEDGMRRAAVAAIVHEGPSPRVLLMKRAERAGDPWSGHISLPGGGFDRGDEDLLVTAIRETHEELGVRLAPEQLVGRLEVLGPRSAGTTPIEVTPFVFRSDALVEPVCGPEATCAFWLPLDVAMSGALDATYTYPHSTLTFPSWSYEGHVIWGLTRRILDDLIAASR